MLLSAMHHAGHVTTFDEHTLVPAPGVATHDALRLVDTEDASMATDRQMSVPAPPLSVQRTSRDVALLASTSSPTHTVFPEPTQSTSQRVWGAHA